MTRYLVGADADQIQSLLFRSAQLREVAGGSELLKDFEEWVGQTYGDAVVTSAGGNVRLAFDDGDAARAACTSLMQAYRAQTGGSLTVCGPEPYEPTDGFQGANEQITNGLRLAKANRLGHANVAHVPYAAICQSCGSDVAVRFASPIAEREDDTEARYLCSLCLDKAEARRPTPSHGRRPSMVTRVLQAAAAGTEGLELEQPDSGDYAADLGDCDPKGYVAYILADGNDMGARFSACQSEHDLTALSAQLDAAAFEALSAPVSALSERLRCMNRDRMLVAPLIVGGDDILFLTTARFSLDCAQTFARAFEEALGEDAHLGVSMVVCQYHYPYRLAYDLATQLLANAKRFGKRHGASAIAFEVVRGNALPRPEPRDAPAPDLVDTAQPYLAGHTHAASPLHINSLIRLRGALAGLPQKRRHEIRGMFLRATGENAGGDGSFLLREELDRMIGRLAPPLTKAFEDEPEATQWQLMHRGLGDQVVYGHVLADVVEMWDQSEPLNRDEAQGGSA